jgi:hypothetical protein
MAGSGGQDVSEMIIRGKYWRTSWTSLIAAPWKSSHPWTNHASALPNAKKAMAVQGPEYGLCCRILWGLSVMAGSQDVGCFRAPRALMGLASKRKICSLCRDRRKLKEIWVRFGLCERMIRAGMVKGGDVSRKRLSTLSACTF